MTTLPDPLPATSDQRALVPALPLVAAPTIGDNDVRSDIASRLRRHKCLFSGVFLLVLGLMAAIYAVVPRSFSGQASILLSTPQSLLGGTDPVVEQKEGDPADLQSQALVLVSLNLLKRVASQPAIAALLARECEIRQQEPIGRLTALLRPFDCRIYATDKTAAARYLQGRLDVSENGISRVINAAYSSPIAKAGELVPNAVADAYIEGRLQDQLNSRSAAVDWLRSEIGRISRDLVRTEARIEAFHREHGLVRGETASLAAEQLTEIGQQLSLARAAQSTAAAQLAQIEKGAADAPATLENQAVGLIKQQLASVAARAAEAEALHGPDYPELIGLRQQQKALRAQLAVETTRIAASLQQTYNAASAKVAALEQELAGAQRRVAAESEAETEIASLQRHADVQRELFVNLSKKVDQLEIERRVVSGNARVISYAQYPKEPAFPRKLPFALGGLILATAASFGATLLRDRGDRTVRSRRDIERAAGVPALCHIPAMRRTALASCRQVMTAGPLQEAIRQLFANSVLFYGADRPRSVLVTSALPRDGKTFVTLSLAQFAARSGRKVLAIEADLRQPDFRRALSLEPAGKGLSAYLRGEAQFEEILRPGGVAGLDVVTAGEPTVDSTELLSSGRARDLLTLALFRYDLVLIDSPPTEILADSYLLAKQVDGVLFCARWGASDTRTVGEALAQLKARGAHVLGLVINRVALRQLPFYEGNKSYGYGYLPLTGS